MPSYQEKITRHTKRQKQNKTKKPTQFKGTEQDMARILELSDWEFKTIIINILRALMDKVDSMHEQMDSVSRWKS